MAHQGQAIYISPRLLLLGARGHSCEGADGEQAHWAPCLTTFILWSVSTVEQGLVRVPKELVPGHRVHKAEVGVAVDEGQPTTQFPQ